MEVSGKSLAETAGKEYDTNHKKASCHAWSNYSALESSEKADVKSTGPTFLAESLHTKLEN